MAILLLEVDSDEQTPIGTYPDIYSARAAALNHALAYAGDSDEQRAEITQLFEECWNAQVGVSVDELAGELERDIDEQWESGAGSYDYRLVGVQVNE